MIHGLDDLSSLRRITGLNPYRWQIRLFNKFSDEQIPAALDIPTGKTAVMAIWLATRAFGKPVPRRLVYVVDRRAVVDQATTEAVRLADNLTAAFNDVAPEQSAIWRANLGLVDNRLPISTLRGEFADNQLWLQNPTRSAIVVGTVDMIGSRILFEGYGVGPRIRPVHAALLANDTLIVLDEAHLVPPFRELLREVIRFRRPAPVPQSRLIALSATGSMQQADPHFASLVSAATTPEPLRPEVKPALLEAWAMTSLERHTGRPNVAPWLRGWVDQVPQAKIVWRSVLPVVEGEEPDKSLLTEFFEALPPHLTEVLEAEANRVADVLKARSAAIGKLMKAAAPVEEFGALQHLAAVTLDSRGKVGKLLSLDDLKEVTAHHLAGLTVVVDARLGGLSPDGLLDSTAQVATAALDGGAQWDKAKRQPADVCGLLLSARKPSKGGSVKPGGLLGAMRKAIRQKNGEWRGCSRRSPNGTPLGSAKLSG